MNPYWSTEVDGELFRFHLRRYLPANLELLSLVLLDGAFLAKSSFRFAGSLLNPGWFFSLTEEACSAEILHYYPIQGSALDPLPSREEILDHLKANGDERVLLRCRASVDKVLNLLWPDTLWSTLKECFRTLASPPPRVDSGSVWLRIADAGRGGNLLTDVLGKHGYDNGFNAVKFPSARAFDMPSNRPWRQGVSSRELIRYGHLGDESIEIDDIMQEVNSRALNLVVYSGAYLTSRIADYRIEYADGGSTSWIDNALRGKPVEEIEEAMASEGGLTRGQMSEECTEMILSPAMSFTGEATNA